MPRTKQPQRAGVGPQKASEHALVISADNALIDGSRSRKHAEKVWPTLTWDARVFVDNGPSPAGNAGPYLHVWQRPEYGAACRVYPRKHVAGMRAEKRNGVWCWVYPAKVPAPTEATVMRQVLAYLRHDPRVLTWRQSTGAARLTGKGGRECVYFFGKQGAADIFGLMRKTGRFIALEVKRPGKHPEAHQASWGAEIVRAGGFYACVHSADEARAAIDRAVEEAA